MKIRNKALGNGIAKMAASNRKGWSFEGILSRNGLVFIIEGTRRTI
jgi:hypothetical protein